MLQIDIRPYASDAIEDAMRLAQTKALNSYSFSDIMNFLNYAWTDIYQRIAQMDAGYYSVTVRLTQRLTVLPPHVKNAIVVYSAQSPVGHDRRVYRASGMNDLQAFGTYHLSGHDLWCPDAERRRVWLNYVPTQHLLFFTHKNRDPQIITDPTLQTTEQSFTYNLWNLQHRVNNRWVLEHRNQNLSEPERVNDITDIINREEDDWEIVYISCDFPYIFVTYRHRFSNEYLSGFYKDILRNGEFTEYNPFAFTGRNSNVEYVRTSWNDKTGLGVTIRDHNDGGRIKTLGWTPDTVLNYPTPDAYRLLVARLADKFSALNESEVMGVQKELVEATYAFDNFLRKDKASWSRITNVNDLTPGDIL